MKENRIDQLKKEYMDIQIPVELEAVVENSLNRGKKRMQKGIYFKRLCTAVASVVLVVAGLTAGINVNETFAQTLLDIPVLGGIVRVLTFKEYTIKDDLYDADIKIPAIEGLKNEDLQNSLNEKYLAENKKLYEEFIADMEDLEKNGGGHMGIDSGYEVKTDTNKILSVGRYVVNIVGSSSTTVKYDTIDKENEILITLPSLFKDDGYVDIISKNIKDQMIEENRADENKIYWVEGIESGIMTDLFDEIVEDQSFYINEEGKLIISFDKYEVAPGYMGVVEFEIPTEILSDVLISEEYIK
jgi:hypothetical protein